MNAPASSQSAPSKTHVEPKAFVGFTQYRKDFSAPERMTIAVGKLTAVVSRFRGRWYATQDWATPHIGRGQGFAKLADAMHQAAAFVGANTMHVVLRQIADPRTIS
jgi:hypothetical protein